MFFTIRNKINVPIEVLRANIIIQSRMRVLRYRLSNGEEKLNKYCMKKYKKPLKLLCLYLVKNLTFKYNQNNEIIATFKSMQADKIAKLVTYGNELVPGSKILKWAIR